MSAPIQVKCSKCAAALRFVPTGEVSTLKCPKCQQQLRFKTPRAVKPGQAGPRSTAPRQNHAPQTRASQTLAATRQPSFPASPTVSPDLDWDDIAAPPPPGPIPGFQGGPAQRGGAPVHYPGSPVPPAKQRKSPGGGRLKPILIGCGALAGLSIVGVVGLVAAIFVLGSMPESRSTISLAGYSADAPGKVAGQTSKDGVESVGVLHRRTNSEFAISTKPVALPGQSFAMDELIRVMKQQGIIIGSTTPVSRAGLSGYRMTMRQLNGLRSEAELFQLNGQQILLVSYVPGNAKLAAGMGKLKLDEEKTKELDDPDAFFTSLRKN
ncbi:hypothetical protein [Allorhodopirellula heiligendammensis]|uniref:Uncharacterized protein n=1 Tax=Allorhodopirellula heiligendammensis TaxID=2714739 RepID=A0A5C6BUS4_9BACT|nr:hypothetical protein [Allorhodopirellula heiligendammensis]TWU15798.1 hypothetical protein Poly21_30000 [Allorhodopirellula heiligendammensis]